MGLWPLEKSIMWWIKTRRNPKWDVSLKLGSKGFFTTIFNLVEDQERVFQGGLYLFNFVGIYMSIWKEKFNSKNEDFTASTVWIILYPLLYEYWHSKILEGIGNTLGSFSRIEETTLQSCYTSFARICVYLNFSKSFPASNYLRYRDVD